MIPESNATYLARSAKNAKLDFYGKLEIENLPKSAQTAIDNIVNDKNSLAHGNDVSVTLQDMIQYYADSIIVINKIDDMLL